MTGSVIVFCKDPFGSSAEDSSIAGEDEQVKGCAHFYGS